MNGFSQLEQLHLGKVSEEIRIFMHDCFLPELLERRYPFLMDTGKDMTGTFLSGSFLTAALDSVFGYNNSMGIFRSGDIDVFIPAKSSLVGKNSLNLPNYWFIGDHDIDKNPYKIDGTEWVLFQKDTYIDSKFIVLHNSNFTLKRKNTSHSVNKTQLGSKINDIFGLNNNYDCISVHLILYSEDCIEDKLYRFPFNHQIMYWDFATKKLMISKQCLDLNLSRKLVPNVKCFKISVEKEQSYIQRGFSYTKKEIYTQ